MADVTVRFFLLRANRLYVKTKRLRGRTNDAVAVDICVFSIER